MSACTQPACSRAAETRGYCSSHYRRRLHTGRYGYRDATVAREHVAALRDLGWTWQAIADAAGLSVTIAHSLHRGTTRRLLHESETALLAIRPRRYHHSHRGVSAVGARRRVQALARLGWPNHEIARRIGCSPRSLPTLLSRGSLSMTLAHRIADVYLELRYTLGPSRAAIGKAIQYGFQPPAAWIAETIDDPDARPLRPALGAA